MGFNITTRLRVVIYMCFVLLRRFHKFIHIDGYYLGSQKVVKTMFQLVTFPIYVRNRGKNKFEFEGNVMPYFCHWYNLTFDNERAVEVSIFLRIIEKYSAAEVLEIGAVLSNYIDHDHLVIDKYEPGKHILNTDIVDVSMTNRFPLIISISTLEHIGFDEYPQDNSKVVRAVEVIKRHLGKEGLFVASVPVAYNRNIDLLVTEEILFDHQYYLERKSGSNRWTQTSKDKALQRDFNSPYPFGNALVIGIVGDSSKFIDVIAELEKD